MLHVKIIWNVDRLLHHCAMEMELWNFVLVLFGVRQVMSRTVNDMLKSRQKKVTIILKVGMERSSFAVLCGTFGRRGTSECRRG